MHRCTDVGSSKPCRYAVDDSFVQWTATTSHYIYLWIVLVSTLCCVNYVPRSRLLRRPISVSNGCNYVTVRLLLCFTCVIICQLFLVKGVTHMQETCSIWCKFFLYQFLECLSPLLLFSFVTFKCSVKVKLGFPSRKPHVVKPNVDLTVTLTFDLTVILNFL